MVAAPQEVEASVEGESHAEEAVKAYTLEIKNDVVAATQLANLNEHRSMPGVVSCAREVFVFGGRL